MQKAGLVIALGLMSLYFSGLFFLSAQNPQRDVDKPATLDKYDLVARGKMSQDRRMRPVQVARMDNNGEILYACKEAKTIEQLKSIGIKCLQSQMELLVDWDLLEYDRKNKTYKTTIHIYGAAKSTVIRQNVMEAVKKMVNSLNADLDSLKNHLVKIDREKSLFAILYGYVLHDYAMNQFGEEIYRKPQLSAEHPFWNGFAWAIYPVKKFPTGVTVMPVKGNKFFFISAAGVPRFNFRQLNAFLKDVATDNKVDEPELVKSLSVFGLFDDKGKLSIPIFESEWSTKLENMAKRIYAQTIELADSEEMKEILGMGTQAQAAMFLHYEIRYAFLYYLIEKGIIEAPADFENEDNNSPQNMKNLVFLIKTEKSS